MKKIYRSFDFKEIHIFLNLFIAKIVIIIRNLIYIYDDLQNFAFF